jgi:hypothetical protein
MKISNLLFAAVLAVVLVATPAFAITTVFNNGFEDGTLCSWGPTGCTTLALVDTSAESPVSGHEEWADYTVQFTVHAGGRDLWFEKEAERSVNPNLTKGFWFSIESGAGVTYNGGITPFWVSATCTAPCADTPTHFKVGANTTKTFWLIVRLDNIGATEGTYRMRMKGMSYRFDGNNGDGVTLITNIPSGFVTPTRFVDDQDTGNLGVDANSYDDFHNNL